MIWLDGEKENETPRVFKNRAQRKRVCFWEDEQRSERAFELVEEARRYAACEDDLVGLAQLVEHRIVVPGVVGSSPISHPTQNEPGLAGLIHKSPSYWDVV